MKNQIELSPLGTARGFVTVPDAGIDPDNVLLTWLKKIRERLNDLYNIDDVVALIAWELARWQSGLTPLERQAVILLVLLMLVQDRQGSTRVALRSTRGKALRLEFARSLLGGLEITAGLDPLDPPQAAEVMLTLIDKGSLESIVGQPGSFKPLIDAGSHLYFQRMFELENRFTSALKTRTNLTPIPAVGQKLEDAMVDILARPVATHGKPVELNDEQRHAVRLAAQHALTIISGGPGTGKTTIILSILRVVRRLDFTCEEIALAAPTGKAANRMRDAIHVGREAISHPSEIDEDLINLTEPQTLHRLLGYSHRTGQFQHHHNNRLSERILIVDEASMIDLNLMARLVRSLRDDSLFVLLGDAHQLPSVEAGSVLRDLLAVRESAPGLGLHSIELTESHRMRRGDRDGLNILTVAQKIDRGECPGIASTDTDPSFILEQSSVAGITFKGVEFLSSPEGSHVLDEFLNRWCDVAVRSLPGFDRLIDHVYPVHQGRLEARDHDELKQLFAHWGDSRILCLTRVRPTGADRINAVLHGLVLDRARENRRRRKQVELDTWTDFIPGEPVLMQVNDYERGIFNGDQGIILNCSEYGNSTVAVVFQQSQGFAVFPVESLRSVLRHSYAMTVHKAQGSEFNRIALVLPDRDLPINTPEILYTALTRSRKSVVIVGRREIFNSGVTRTVLRDSGIVEKLRD